MDTNENKVWYYASASNERLGPVSIVELSALAGQGLIEPSTLVWSPEHAEWIPASKIADLLTAARKSKELTPAPSEESPEIPSQELKPRMGPFLFPIFLGVIIASAIAGLAVGAVCYSFDKSVWYGFAASSVILVFGILSALATYRKERYQLQHSRLICHRGGLFRDEATELEIRNITHVKVKLPWLRYKLFRTGDVIVETAGTSKPMVMRAIREPETVYAEMRGRMKYNGYDLSKRELLHEEKPSILGVIVECIGHVVAAVVIMLFFFGAIVSEQEEAGATPFDSYLPYLLPIGAIFLTTAIIYAIFRFLDFRLRTYSVFNDVVVYEEGFLTRHNAFIPYENIADSNTKRTFIDQILGLYDVHVSCQGSASEIKFRRLRNGIGLSNAIDLLVSSASKKPKSPRRSSSDDPTIALPKRPSRVEPEAVPAGEIRTSEHRIHAMRLLVPQLFLLPLFPIWVLTMVKSLILLSSTRYFVRPDSLRHSYKFLTVDDREFSYDKVTGLVIKRNLWDKCFGTMTLKFWSIGSGKSLEFAHVHCEQVDLPALMRQVGIPPVSQEPYETDARFGIFPWLRARIWIVFVFLLYSAGVLAAAALEDEPLIYLLLLVPALAIVIGLIHAILYYPRQRLRFHEHHVEAEQGIIAKVTFFVRYKNVKRVSSTRYPGGEEGDLEIYVAGEEQAHTQQAQGKAMKTMMKQCSFMSRMLPQPIETAALLDDILSGRINSSITPIPAEAGEVLVESKRALGNAIVNLLLISILIFPLLPLLPITIPLTIIRVKRWRYRIEDFRIVTNHGALFRKETSVLLDRVDSLQQSQGFLNKIFRNGKVSIMTAGSSKPDLILIDSPDYLKLHEEIRRRSQ